MESRKDANVSRRESKLGSKILGEVKDNRISSVNRVILCREPTTSMPFMSGWQQTASVKGSKAKINTSGESGQT